MTKSTRLRLIPLVFLTLMNLKSNLLLSLVLLLSIPSFSQTFSGKWLVEKKDAYVKIYKRGNKFFGQVYKIGGNNDKNGKPKLDIKNPDKKKKTQKVQGMEFLTNFSLKDNVLLGGKIYDARNGKSYKAKLWIENGTLKVRGFVGFFYETHTWTRVK